MSIQFSKGTLGDDGKMVITDVRTLEQSSIKKCPHYIMVPEHYREDESCRCDEKDNTDMAEWGYEWDGGKWV